MFLQRGIIGKWRQGGHRNQHHHGHHENLSQETGLDPDKLGPNPCPVSL